MTETTSPSGVDRVGDLQVAQDLRFQRRMWKVQRVGWALFALLALAALVGLLGSGPLSTATARAGDALEVRYPRIARHGAEHSMTVRVATGEADADGTVELWVARSYLDAIEVRDISPTPDQTRAGADRVTYTFALDAGDHHATISFDVVPIGLWARRGQMGLGDGPAVTFRQFVLP